MVFGRDSYIDGSAAPGAVMDPIAQLTQALTAALAVAATKDSVFLMVPVGEVPLLKCLKGWNSGRVMTG